MGFCSHLCGIEKVTSLPDVSCSSCVCQIKDVCTLLPCSLHLQFYCAVVPCYLVIFIGEDAMVTIERENTPGTF
jgi:hypothetical protein